MYEFWRLIETELQPKQNGFLPWNLTKNPLFLGCKSTKLDRIFWTDPDPPVDATADIHQLDVIQRILFDNYSFKNSFPQKAPAICNNYSLQSQKIFGQIALHSLRLFRATPNSYYYLNNTIYLILASL